MALGNWLKALGRTRQTLMGGVAKIFRGGSPDAKTIAQVEEAMLRADIPARLAAEITERLSTTSSRGEWQTVLRALLLEPFASFHPFQWKLIGKPTIILIVGVNGSGKTTTAAKLARMVGDQGYKALLGAADTFRAAGSDQLRIWAERVGCDVVGGQQGADSAAVAYDSVQAAIARQTDVVIIDTAGRMHTKRPLMDELTKIRRSLAKSLPGAPHHTWMVLDATLGNNALRQAEAFHQAVGLTGVIVSKLDGSSKAGFLLAAARDLQIPILFAGLGEAADDLASFDPAAFVDALLVGADDASASTAPACAPL